MVVVKGTTLLLLLLTWCSWPLWPPPAFGAWCWPVSGLVPLMSFSRSGGGGGGGLATTCVWVLHVSVRLGWPSIIPLLRISFLKAEETNLATCFGMH